MPHTLHQLEDQMDYNENLRRLSVNRNPYSKAYEHGYWQGLGFGLIGGIAIASVVFVYVITCL